MKTHAIRDATREIDKWERLLLIWQNDQTNIRVSLHDNGREVASLSAKALFVEEALRQNAIGFCLAQLAAAKAAFRAALETP